MSKEVVEDFERYARVCYESFGDLVKFWFTINGECDLGETRLADIPEPNVFSLLGHCFGKHAPGRSSDRRISPEGDSQIEPYTVGHHLLLSHASAVKVFRELYGETDKQIGLVVNMNWGGR